MHKVVLVDDEPWNLQGLEQLVDWQQHGFDIALSTTKPLEAYEFIQKQKCGLLITDIRMPGISGIEFIQKLRAEGSEIECVFLSGYEDFDYARQAISAGVAEYCLKPLKAADLSALLEKINKKLSNKEEIGRASCRERV